MEPPGKLAAGALCGLAQLCLAGAAGARNGTAGGGANGKASYIDLIDGSQLLFD